jgi:hypothetical protein
VIDLGIITPVVTLIPGAHARWERTGTIGDVARIARAADELGYHHLTCSQHVAVPVEVADIRGGRYWDPVATLATWPPSPSGSGWRRASWSSATTIR